MGILAFKKLFQYNKKWLSIELSNYLFLFVILLKIFPFLISKTSLVHEVYIMMLIFLV